MQAGKKKMLEWSGEKEKKSELCGCQQTEGLLESSPVMLSKCHNSAGCFFNHNAYGGAGSQLSSLSPDFLLLRDAQPQSAHTGKKKRAAAGKHSPLKESTRMFTQAESPRNVST